MKFTDGAIRAVAEKAYKRKTGARGLRSILEDIMLDIMYDLPSSEDIEEVAINKEVISKREQPLLVYQNRKQAS